MFVDVVPVQCCGPGGGVEVARQHFHCRAFASPIGPEEAQHLTGIHFEADVVDGLLRAVDLRQIRSSDAHEIGNKSLRENQRLSERRTGLNRPDMRIDNERNLVNITAAGRR